MNDTLKLEYAEFIAKGTQGKKELCTKPDGDFFFFGFSLMNFNNRYQILSGSIF